MKIKTLLFLVIVLNLGCSQSQSIEDLSLEVTQNLKRGNIEYVKEQFYSPSYFESITDGEKSLRMYHEMISEIEIDKKENINIDTITANLNHPILPKGISQIIKCYVPVGIEMPSLVPKYFFVTHFFNHSGSYKLISLELNTTESPIRNNSVEIEKEIKIKKEDIVNASFMYEGGFKQPMVFKKNEVTLEVESIYTLKLDTLIYLINNSEITKAQKENDSRRFNGDPELGVITLNLADKFNWSLFKLIEGDENEDFHGVIELRYYQYMNLATTYWIRSQDDEALNRIMLELCHSGENKRTKPKESIKLQIGKE